MAKAPSPAVGSRRLARLALTVVLVALLCLAALPLIMQRRTERLNNEIAEAAAPARDVLTQLQLALALESASTRGFLLTGDSAYVATHEEATRERKKAYDHLLSLTSLLGAGVRTRAAELGRTFDTADRRLDLLYNGQISRADYMRQFPEQQAMLTSALRTVAELDDAMGHEVQVRMSRMASLHQLETVISIGLVALALCAVLLVAKLGQRVRSTAVQLQEQTEKLLASEQRLREAAQESERRTRELQRVTESRAGLMRGFSHDVKNPLGAAGGHLELLALEIQGPLTEKQKDSVSRAQRSLNSAVGLIEDLLNLAKAETIEIDHSSIDLRAIVRELAEENRARAEQKGLTLAVRLPDQFPVIQNDGTRIRQILGNLVSNAIKYTERGTVSIAALISKNSQTGPPSAVVEVADTGPGIPGDQQKLLFQEFKRLDTSRGTNGSGLGLAISDRLARALGGEISVHSEPGKGSIFSLRLPLNHGESDTGHESPPIRLAV